MTNYCIYTSLPFVLLYSRGWSMCIFLSCIGTTIVFHPAPAALAIQVKHLEVASQLPRLISVAAKSMRMT